MSEKPIFLFNKDDNISKDKTPKKSVHTPKKPKDHNKKEYNDLKKGLETVFIKKTSMIDPEEKLKEQNMKKELEELKNGLYNILTDLDEKYVTHNEVLIKKKTKQVKKNINISDIWKYLKSNLREEDYKKIRKRTRELMKEKYGDKCDTVCCKKPSQMTTIKENGKCKKVKVTEI